MAHVSNPPGAIPFETRGDGPGLKACEARLDYGVRRAWVLSTEPGAIFLRTSSGSFVHLSSRRADGGRAYRYHPAPGARRPPQHGVTTLCGPIAIGTRLRLGDLSLSATTAIALDTLAPRVARSEKQTFVPAGRSPEDIGDALREYEAKVMLLRDARVSPGEWLMLECEILGVALLAQRTLGGGSSLDAVRSFSTVGGGVYVLDRGESVTVSRVASPGTAGTVFAHVEIAPQQIVPGAPLVLSAPQRADTAALPVCFTTPIVTVALR